MRILGICWDVWISSAVLFEDGRVLAGAAEERFVRQKMTRVFPVNAIRFCLEKAGIKMEDVDYVTLGWNPGIHLKKFNQRFSGSQHWRGQHLYTVPNHLLSLLDEKKVNYIEQSLVQPKSKTRIVYVTHHLAHAANAFFLSPFEESAILSVDGHGEDDTALFAAGRGNRISELKTIKMPHSLGLFYATFTQFLGFEPHIDEWKVMALASYGSKENEYYEKARSLVKFLPEGGFELDLSCFNYYLYDQLHFYTDKFVKLFGEPRPAGGEISHRHHQIAWALQKVVEETATQMLNWLQTKTGMKNITVGGGFFMNSVFNGKIIENTNFEHLFISSCPDDSGTALGSALYLYHEILGQTERAEQRHNYYGPTFSNKEIKTVLDKYGIRYNYVEEIEKHTARLIADGKLIGWFQGAMEFGQRALGNRSILADPRDPEMKNKVNLAVKYRETFRPFAPSILEERVVEFFAGGGDLKTPFMEKVFMVKEDKRAAIPAVVHVDGSGRLQTVSRKINERYYKLIEEFHRITGLPVVLNTSFNLKGEPIVCTPADAIKTFFSCGLNGLVLGNYVVLKS